MGRPRQANGGRSRRRDHARRTLVSNSNSARCVDSSSVTVAILRWYNWYASSSRFRRTNGGRWPFSSSDVHHATLSCRIRKVGECVAILGRCWLDPHKSCHIRKVRHLEPHELVFDCAEVRRRRGRGRALRVGCVIE